MDLLIYKYNNYYNRIVKKESSLYNYGSPIYSITNVKDFTPNDHVNTSHLFGTRASNYNGEGDYLIVTEGNTIISRWFIIETQFTRQGQWQLQLRRDLVVDFYDDIISAKCLVEKATLAQGDPLMFNSEGMSFNQIKKDEYLLKDETESQWLVAYVTRQSIENNQNPTPLSVQIKYDQELIPDYIASSVNDLPFTDLIFNTFEYGGDIKYDIFATYGKPSTYINFNTIDKNGIARIPAKVSNPANPVPDDGWGFMADSIPENEFIFGYENRDYILGYLNTTPIRAKYNVSSTYANRYFAPYLYDAIMKNGSFTDLDDEVKAALGIQDVSSAYNPYLNKIVKIGDTYYRTQIQVVGSKQTRVIGVEEYLPNVASIFKTAYNNAITAYAVDHPEQASLMSSAITSTLSSSNNFVGIRIVDYGTARIRLVPLGDSATVNARLVTDATAATCIDAPYDLICMPYSNDLVVKTSLGDFQSNKQLALATMSALLAQEGGSGAVKDVQLLPYCPIRDYIATANTISMVGRETIGSNKLVYYVTTDDSTAIKLAPVIYCQKSKFNFTIPFSITIKNTKVESECDMYRLCSPNYAAMFDFNAAKNNGVDYFNVDVHYKPISPYIHLNPNFKGLYGSNYNDARGLICGGDFSITAISDAWIQYELQNKNYEKTFQRGLDNMETQHDAARRQEKVAQKVGILQATATGAGAGLMVGGGIGAAIGGIIGTAASAYGASQDRAINESLRAEALDYAKALHSYQLDNIKALSNTIAKVSSINPNNKGFPVLEYYSCTDQEKNALANKIAYGGMTVGVIGTLNDYLGNFWSYNGVESQGYIKGSIIKMEELHDDFHLLKSISEEIYKGVFIKNG